MPQTIPTKHKHAWFVLGFLLLGGVANQVNAQTITEIPYEDETVILRPNTVTLAEVEDRLQEAQLYRQQLFSDQLRELHQYREKLARQASKGSFGYTYEVYQDPNQRSPYKKNYNTSYRGYGNSIADYYKNRDLANLRIVRLKKLRTELIMADAKETHLETKWDKAVEQAERELELARKAWLLSLNTVNDYRARNLPDNQQTRLKLNTLEQSVAKNQAAMHAAQDRLVEAMRARSQALRDSFVEPQDPAQPKKPAPKINPNAS